MNASVIGDRMPNAASRARRALESISEGNAGEMSVTTGSFGTADVPASSPSLYGLDGVNFFLAAVLAGFGPYVAAYLAEQKWTQADIGFVLTASSVAGLLSQVPGGELLDRIRSKRALVAVGAGIVILSALVIALRPSFPTGFHCASAAGHDRRVSRARDCRDQSRIGWLFGTGRTAWAQSAFCVHRSPGRGRIYGPSRIPSVVSSDICGRGRARTSVVRGSVMDPRG